MTCRQIMWNVIITHTVHFVLIYLPSASTYFLIIFTGKSHALNIAYIALHYIIAQTEYLY